MHQASGARQEEDEGDQALGRARTLKEAFGMEPLREFHKRQTPAKMALPPSRRGVLFPP